MKYTYALVGNIYNKITAANITTSPDDPAFNDDDKFESYLLEKGTKISFHDIYVGDNFVGTVVGFTPFSFEVKCDDRIVYYRYNLTEIRNLKILENNYISVTMATE